MTDDYERQEQFILGIQYEKAIDSSYRHKVYNMDTFITKIPLLMMFHLATN